LKSTVVLLKAGHCQAQKLIQLPFSVLSQQIWLGVNTRGAVQTTIRGRACPGHPCFCSALRQGYRSVSIPVHPSPSQSRIKLCQSDCSCRTLPPIHRRPAPVPSKTARFGQYEFNRQNSVILGLVSQAASRLGHSLVLADTSSPCCTHSRPGVCYSPLL